jgi:predicted ester cyclase
MQFRNIGLGDDVMSAEDDKTVVRRFVEEVQSRRDLDAIDQFVSQDFVNFSAIPGLPNDLNGVKQFHQAFFAAFPDMQATIHMQVAEGDKVVTHKTFHATHQGDFMGVAPTGNRIAFEVIDIVTVAGGKITEHWVVTDQLGLMQQMAAK